MKPMVLRYLHSGDKINRTKDVAEKIMLKKDIAPPKVDLFFGSVGQTFDDIS